MGGALARRLGGRGGLAAFAALALLVALLPQVTDLYLTHLMVIAGIYVLLVFGLQVVLGMAGEFMVGYAAVMSVGAYACALLTVRAHVAFWAALPVATVAAALVSAGVGMVAIRFVGHFVAIITFAFNFIAYEVLIHWDSLTGGWPGIAGVAPPEGIPGLLVWDKPTWYYLVWALIFVLGGLLHRFRRTPWGLTLLAIRDDALAAEASGIATRRTKVLAYAASGAFAGFGGALYASYLSVVDPSQFSAVVSVNILAMLLLGGKDSVLGAALGAVLLSVLPDELRVIENVRWIAYGLILVLMMLVLPGGLAQLAARLGQARRFALRRLHRAPLEGAA
jgi:branched-chain amino acid transport system permease protein